MTFAPLVRLVCMPTHEREITDDGAGNQDVAAMNTAVSNGID
jgi:hypothetical protein